MTVASKERTVVSSITSLDGDCLMSIILLLTIEAMIYMIGGSILINIDI